MTRLDNLNEHGPEPEVRHAAATLPRALPGEDAAFKAYLDAVCTSVAALAPPEWLADLRAELACHLSCTVEAYVELGERRELAAQRACRSLGDPVKLGRRWERYWRDKQPEPFRTTVRLAFVRFAAATLAAPALLLFSWWEPFRRLSPTATHFADLLTFFTVLGLPLVVGVVLARCSRGRVVLGTAAALLAMAALSVVVGPLLPGDDPAGVYSGLWQIHLIYWLPLGCLTAGITSLLRSRRERPRVQRGS
jgi:hypothetical protein